MKIIKNTFFYLITLLLGTTQAFAGPHPPSPTGKKAPSPPGLPIDDGIAFLLIIAITFGIYTIIKFNRNKKLHSTSK